MEETLSRSEQLRSLYRPARKVDPNQLGGASLLRLDEADLLAEIGGPAGDDEDVRIEELVRRMVEERLAGLGGAGGPIPEPEPEEPAVATRTVELRPEEPTGALSALAKLWHRVLVVRSGPEGFVGLPEHSLRLLQDVDGRVTMADLRTAHPSLSDAEFVAAIRAAASQKILRFRQG
jgi:sugar phosphate isomerase/epimerase